MSLKPDQYRCKTCGASVLKTGDGFVRKCGHDEDGVTVSLSATVIGKAKVAS